MDDDDDDQEGGTDYRYDGERNEGEDEADEGIDGRQCLFFFF